MMTRQVGYLTNFPDRLDGEHGAFFDYILAANGLFIQAANPMLTARVPVAECDIRGLAPLKPKITLTYGSIPQRFFDLALDTFLASPDKEGYVAVIANAGYHLYVPDGQLQEEGKVVYKVGDSVVLEVHSHGHIPAFFSTKDNTDETGMKVYVVVGDLRKEPMVCLRVGVYGYFWPLLWKDVFDGTLYGAKEIEDEEVITDELHGSVVGEARAEVHSSGMWWNRWFRS